MSGEPTSGSQPGPTGRVGDDGRLRELFFDGLPAMVGIVTLTVQPFAQESVQQMFGISARFPIGVAIVVSGFLAVYKLWIVRKSSPIECAVCVPLLMLVIFSGYATGNNIVFYAKAGFTRPDLSTQPSSNDLAALKQEKDSLQQQLESARDLIATFQRVLGPPATTTGAPHAFLPRVLGMLVPLDASEAVAQPSPPDASGGLRPEQRQQLQDALKKYEEEQRHLELRRKESEPKGQTQQPGEQRSPPLIKSL